MRLRLLVLVSFSGLMAIQLSACGLLFGNTKPVAEKSDAYGVAELNKENPEWMRLDPSQVGEESKPSDPQNTAESNDPSLTASGIPDVVFQSTKTASTISLSSACRPGSRYDSSLQSLTNLLLLGIDVTQRDEKELELQGVPALQTTIQGMASGKPITMRTTVVKKASCIYDLVLLSTPDRFTVNEGDYSHFVASLRIK